MRETDIVGELKADFFPFFFFCLRHLANTGLVLILLRFLLPVKHVVLRSGESTS